MTAQLTLDGHARTPAEVEGDRAIERVARGRTTPEWFGHAHKAVRRVARSLDTFTTDDVWCELEVGARIRGFDPAPPEPRAMGAVMRWAVREGWCVATEDYRRSERPECHARPLLVWRSRR